LSLVSDGGVEALKEMLILYDFRGSATNFPPRPTDKPRRSST
jgi:hypothetical protein